MDIKRAIHKVRVSLGHMREAVVNYDLHFKGRGTRTELLLTLAFAALIIYVTTEILPVILPWGPQTPKWIVATAGNLSAIILAIASLTCVAALVRRFHDVGGSAWWLLAFGIPFFGMVVVLYMPWLDPNEGDNHYGPNPRH